MEALSAPEMQIMRSMLVKEYGSRSTFLDQLAAAGVESRESTGGGVFVNLRIAENVAPVDEINLEISEGYPTKLAAPADVVGFTLFIRNGYLSFLEGYTFGEVQWPGEPPENWLILQPVGIAKQKVK